MNIFGIGIDEDMSRRRLLKSIFVEWRACKLVDTVMDLFRYINDSIMEKG